MPLLTPSNASTAMTTEPPETGLVIRYSFLWPREHDRGERDGRKARPACLVVPLNVAPRAVVLFPITTQPPGADRIAIEVPETERRRLRLPGLERCWVMLDEANADIMPGSLYVEPLSYDPVVTSYGRFSPPFTQDLFSSSDETFLDDVGLLNDLATQRLEDAAAPMREFWKWVEPAHEVSYETINAMGRIYPEAADLPDEVQEEFDAITDQINAFEHADELSDLEQAEWEGLETRYAEIEAMAAPVFAPELMALAGVFLSIGHQGELKVEAGMVRGEDMQALVDLSKAKEAAAMEARQAERLAAIAAAAAEDGSDEPDTASAYIDVDAEPERTVPALRFQAPRSFKPASTDDEAEAGPSMSGALVADLRAIRHQVFQAHLASDFEVAFDLTLFSMCQSAFSIGYSRKPIDLSITSAQTYGSEAHRTGTVSETILAALKANLRLEWMALPKAESFNAMCALTPAEKQALFTFAAAQGVQQQLSTDSDAIPAIEAAGARMDIAVEENWRPTAANYFGRVKKAMLLETACETIDAQWAHDHSGGKKADFAKTMELAFGPDGRQRVGIAADAADRTTAWLPVGMAFAGKHEATVTAAPLMDDAASVEHDEGEAGAALPAFLTGGDAEVPAFLTASQDVEDEVPETHDFVGVGYDPMQSHYAIAAE
ncbi:hypothetical protein [Aureimonas ureilytica]|uniref:hypothetical protein n=1 Tax=Aureimonas ureilytica TaxID=401562 RepID=UPI00178C9C14|nr:hypothetical protein [Aureimonas ureilytica]